MVPLQSYFIYYSSTHPEVFYSTYTTAVCQKLQLKFESFLYILYAVRQKTGKTEDSFHYRLITNISNYRQPPHVNAWKSLLNKALPETKEQTRITGSIRYESRWEWAASTETITNMNKHVNISSWFTAGTTVRAALLERLIAHHHASCKLNIEDTPSKRPIQLSK